MTEMILIPAALVRNLCSESRVVRYKARLQLDKHLAAAKTLQAQGDGRRLMEFAQECAAIGNGLVARAQEVLQAEARRGTEETNAPSAARNEVEGAL